MEGINFALRIEMRQRLIRFWTIWNRIEDEHHSHVLVFQVMAMKYEWTMEGSKLHEQFNFRVRTEHSDVALVRPFFWRGLPINLLDLV
jgi:hypothetical protein